MDSLGDSTAKVPLRILRQVDEICDAFDAHLAGGMPAVFEPFIARVNSEGRSLLVGELVAIASERLRRYGLANPIAIIVAMNPELRTEIEAAQIELSDRRETQVFDHANSPSPTLQTPRRKRSRGLRIRCPHCSNHVELVGDTPLDSVDCTVCGSNFSLVDRSTETRMAEVLQRIDRFELVSRLGVGGFGTVWKARDTDLDRAVAIKIPRYGQLSTDEIEQFFREARSVAQLRHPNIASVYEVGREGDTVFIVTDLIRGVSLADMLTGRRPTLRESATLCATIADALDHAHRKGIIHRDLKPSNIMIDDNGTPYLMDFGLAKQEADEITMTTDGQVIGTPAYMSPEQAGGNSAWADRRTDVYSLGVILFELLTGELPFRGNAQMQVHQRLKDEAPSILSLNRHLPKDLATICAKCLEREPGRRFQSAKELGDELRRFLAGEPIIARPVSAIERGIRWAARKPLQATILGLVTFLAIAGPMTALRIKRSENALVKRNAENSNLIIEREREGNEAMASAAELESKLAIWEGRANPWALWPPNPAEPPKLRQMASLLGARSAALEKPGSSETENAQRLLALATLCEGTNRPDDGLRHLMSAADILTRIVTEQPTNVGASLALADCYDRISNLTIAKDREESRSWLDKSLRIRRQLADMHVADAQLQAQRLDGELRLGAFSGFDKATEQLAAAEKLNSRLSTLWPTSAAEMYRIASQLAGRQAWLDMPPQTRSQDSTDADGNSTNP